MATPSRRVNSELYWRYYTLGAIAGFLAGETYAFATHDHTRTYTHWSREHTGLAAGGQHALPAALALTTGLGWVAAHLITGKYGFPTWRWNPPAP